MNFLGYHPNLQVGPTCGLYAFLYGLCDINAIVNTRKEKNRVILELYDKSGDYSKVGEFFDAMVLEKFINDSGICVSANLKTFKSVKDLNKIIAQLNMDEFIVFPYIRSESKSSIMHWGCIQASSAHPNVVKLRHSADKVQNPTKSCKGSPYRGIQISIDSLFEANMEMKNHIFNWSSYQGVPIYKKIGRRLDRMIVGSMSRNLKLVQIINRRHEDLDKIPSLGDIKIDYASTVVGKCIVVKKDNY